MAKKIFEVWKKWGVANQRPLNPPLNNGLYEESYDDGTIEHDSEPTTEVLKGVENG